MTDSHVNAVTPSETSSETNLVNVTGLCKSFPTTTGTLEVLSDLFLQVKPAEMVAVVGESGVGKSTLLHLLGGLDLPTSGTIHCAGTDIISLSEDQRSRFRNRQIGFVFQFHHLLEDFTALENIMLPALAAGVSRAGARKRAEELLEAVSLTDRADHLPAALSGGEQQRVAVARALANHPQLLLADEPTGNLDITTGERLHELLVEINKREGSAFVIATHNLELAKRCSAVYKLTGGALAKIPR